MSSAKKTLSVIASLVVIGAGLMVGVVLVRQRQLIRKEAAVPKGVAETWLDPEQQSVDIGDTFTVDIMFSTAGRAISGIDILLSYSYSGAEPPLSVTDIQLNSAEGFENDSLWSFSQISYKALDGVAQVQIAGANFISEGYTTDGTLLATLTFSADSEGSITVSFDPLNSIITETITAEDILLIPTSVGVYTVQAAATATPIPTEPSDLTLTPTDTLDLTNTPTPTTSEDGIGGSVPTSTLTPTPTIIQQPVPDSGVGLPTLVMLAMGMLMIIGGWLLLLD
jgi:hypothetical protein